MKKVTIILMAVLFLATLALAGDDATPKGKSGDEALLFSLNGLSNLGAGNFMGGVGAKYYFQDNMAFRLGVGFGWNGYTQTVTGGNDQKDHTIGFSLDPGITYTIATSGPVSAYVGGQVMFGWQQETKEYLGEYDKEVITGTNFGFGGLAGVEWFPWNNVSLSAEYGLSLSFGSGSDEVTSGTTTTKTDGPSTTSLNLGSNGGSNGTFTLAIYF